MLRKTAIKRKIGDFILTLPNESVYRSIFTLASDSTNSETETLARQIVSRAKLLAESGTAAESSAVRGGGKFSPSHSTALVASNILFSSPLFKLAGVPTSADEPDTLFVWAPTTTTGGTSTSSAASSPIVVAWSGVQQSSATSAAKKIIAATASADGGINFFEASLVPSATASLAPGRVAIKLGNKIELVGSDKDAAKNNNEDGGASMASALVQAQLRLDHAAWVWRQIRSICKTTVEVGTNVKFQAERMSDSSFFHERVGSMGASEHALFAAIQHTAMTLAESLTVASPALLNKTDETKAQTLAKDIDYDSGLLYLYSRTLLQAAIQSADKLLLRHGAAVPPDAVFGCDKESWVASAQNCDLVPVFELASRLGDYVVSSSASSSASSAGSASTAKAEGKNADKKKASPSSSTLSSAPVQGTNGVQQIISSLFKSKEAETFSDVHMNLTSSTAPLMRDFNQLKKSASSSSSSTTPSTKQLLPFIASELMGTTSLAYYTSNAVELGEGLGDSVNTGDFPGSEMFATKVASPTEASAVAWLALEVAGEASRNRRGALLRDLEVLAKASSSSAGFASASEMRTTHPMKLPRVPEQKQQQQQEGEEA